MEQVGHGLALRISDPNGQNVLTSVKEDMNLMPTWLPDSEQLVWMKVKPQPKQDPARNAQIHLVNVKTGQARRLFTDKEQLKYSNAMPVVSPKADRIAFVSNRSGNMRVRRQARFQAGDGVPRGDPGADRAKGSRLVTGR